MPANNETLEERYAREVGHPPRNLPEDHPDRWQWLYQGTKAEREELRERLGLPPVEDLPPAVSDAQEELF